MTAAGRGVGLRGTVLAGLVGLLVGPLLLDGAALLGGWPMDCLVGASVGIGLVWLWSIVRPYTLAGAAGWVVTIGTAVVLGAMAGPGFPSDPVAVLALAGMAGALTWAGCRLVLGAYGAGFFHGTR